MKKNLLPFFSSSGVHSIRVRALVKPLRKSLRKSIIFATVVFAAIGVLAACSSTQKANDTTASTGVAKAPSGASTEANLTQAEAELRASIVGSPVYRLSIDVDEKSDQFRGHLIATFQLLQTGKSTFLDFQDGAKIEKFNINGKPQPTSFNGHRLKLPADALHAGSNEVVIFYTQTYSHVGRGLHRFQDPEDQRVYLYSQFEAYDAHQMFPCFDQPDIKGRMSLKVTAPPSWEVVSTTREKSVSDLQTQKLWIFGDTPQLSTYLFSLHAGPYEKWEAMAGDIPLRLFVRQALKKYVRPEAWFKLTRQGLEFYNNYFAYPYPFAKYDQLIVPDFNAGAMENAAAVTFSERYVRRGTETREDQERLASVLLHEMAHMWFGDLVTMKWWNGLWLNESFATFMSALAQEQATEFKESWTTFQAKTKSWAYWEDQLVTTHPINGQVADTNSAFTNFDGITYGKGASVLKQLRFFVGDTAFRNGVRSYFTSYAYGNTRLEDFISAIAQSSQRDLNSWSQTWLELAGLDSVKAEFLCEGTRISKFALKLKNADGGLSPRAHRTVIGLYNKQISSSGAKAEKIVLTKTIEVEYRGDLTNVADLVGQDCPDMVYPNEQDNDYVKVVLDSRTLEAAKTNLKDVVSQTARTMFWSDLYQMVRDTELAPQEYLKIALANLPAENDIKTINALVSKLDEILYYLPQSDAKESAARTAFVSQIETALFAKSESAKPGSDIQVEAWKGFVNVSESIHARELLYGLLTKTKKINGLDLDLDRRWKMLVQLVSLGDPRADALLAAMRTEDQSERGIQNAIEAEASKPDLAVKKEWFKKVLEQKDMPLARGRAALHSFLPRQQDNLRETLANDFYANLPQVAESREAEFQELYSESLLPAVCKGSSAEKLDQLIRKSGSHYPPVITKILKIGHQEDQRCVAIRAKARSF